MFRIFVRLTTTSFVVVVVIFFFSLAGIWRNKSKSPNDGTTEFEICSLRPKSSYKLPSLSLLLLFYFYVFFRSLFTATLIPPCSFLTTTPSSISSSSLISRFYSLSDLRASDRSYDDTATLKFALQKLRCCSRRSLKPWEVSSRKNASTQDISARLACRSLNHSCFLMSFAASFLSVQWEQNMKDVVIRD